MCGNETLKCVHKMFINKFIKKIPKNFTAPFRMYFTKLNISTQNTEEMRIKKEKK
jgi:hypothetical protein